MNETNDGRPKAGAIASFGATDNVVELSAFRARNPVPSSSKHDILYVSESGSCLEPLISFRYLRVHEVRSLPMLKARLMASNPELVLLDSTIRWANPLETIDYLGYLLEVPIVLLCDPTHREHTPELIKRAYAAGIHDALYTPLREDELNETLTVLLRLRRNSI